MIVAIAVEMTDGSGGFGPELEMNISKAFAEIGISVLGEILLLNETEWLDKLLKIRFVGALRQVGDANSCGIVTSLHLHGIAASIATVSHARWYVFSLFSCTAGWWCWLGCTWSTQWLLIIWYLSRN